jgi:hypothetical protein
MLYFGVSKDDQSSLPPAGEFRLDRTAFSVSTLAGQDDDGVYWQSKTPLERLVALEYLRRMAYGAAAFERLQRVLSVARLGDL